MARKRPPERPSGDDRRPSQVTDRRGMRRVTMWLPSDTAKKLRHAAIEDDVEIGQVAAPAIGLALAGRYWVERAAKPPARPVIAVAADGDAPEELERGDGLGIAG